MGRDRNCVRFHIHQPGLVINDCTSVRSASRRVRDYERHRHCVGHVHLCLGLWCVVYTLLSLCGLSHISKALGPLFLGPLSEIFGRSRVLQLANLWYLGECVLPRLLANVLN